VDLQTVAQQKQAIIDRFGEWTDHNIHLGNGLYTIKEEAFTPKLRRILQVVADLARAPLDQLRIVDLACLEGQYAIEFARHGAEAVGIEGREPGVQKGRFVKEVLGLNKLELFRDDIRNLSPDKYGEFDVVLCLGVYYHLDVPDLFELMERMFQTTRHLLVIDTFVGVTDRECYEYKGRKYWGISVKEHSPTATSEQKLADQWASLDNTKSVWLTTASLLNLLVQVGFTSVYECHVPYEPGKPQDRVTIVAVKGQRQPIHASPRLDQMAEVERPEKERLAINPLQSGSYDLRKRLTHLVPRPVRGLLKWALCSVGLMRRERRAPWEWRQPWTAR
jgi:SAM-dependent methyltransferase